MARAISYWRFSTGAQAKGDSLHRQTEAARSYCEAHGDELDLSFIDAGVSAYRGRNATEGDLKRLVELAEAGQFEPGTKLLIEHLDRLSRADVLTAQDQFHRLLRRGLTIVTLMDQQAYTYERVKSDLAALVIPIVLMFKANQDSADKGARVAKAKAARRDRVRAGKAKMTRRCPEWLRAEGEGEAIEFVPIADRVAIVRRIFEECIAGLGKRAIAGRLNRDNIPAFRGRNGWHHSSVQKVLTNDATIGIFHPCRMQDGKRAPDGEPIEGYYPAIIDDEVFWRAQGAIKGRLQAASGAKGRGYSNILSGLGKCAAWGSTLVFINKGSPPKGGQYLACGKAVRGLCKNRTHHAYAGVESGLIGVFSLLPAAERMLTLIRGETGSGEIDPSVQKLNALEKQAATKTTQLHRLISAFEKGDSSTPHVQSRIRQLEKEVSDCEHQLVNLRGRIRTSEANRRRDIYKEFTECLAQLTSANVREKDHFLLRAKLHQAFRENIDSLVFDGDLIKVIFKLGHQFFGVELKQGVVCALLFKPYLTDEENLVLADILRATIDEGMNPLALFQSGGQSAAVPAHSGTDAKLKSVLNRLLGLMRELEQTAVRKEFRWVEITDPNLPLRWTPVSDSSASWRT